MYMWNFNKYNEEAEKTGGDYWSFLDATTDTILNDNIFLYKIHEVIKEIKNEDLKLKMKKKIFDLIVEKGIFFNGLENSLDLFSCDELKSFFEHEFNITIIKYIDSQDKIRCHNYDIINFINLLEKVNDSEWEYRMITNILNIINNHSDKVSLINIVESNKNHSEIYNRLIRDYHSYFPEEYKNFLKMNQDPYYMYNRSLQFMNEDIDIGIDPKISIGPEIEANNDYNIKVDFNQQKGFEGYDFYSDATVANGSEIAPNRPFHNVKEDVAKFCGLCEALKDIGYYYSEVKGNAAGQINLGLDYLDTKEAILNFYEIYGNCEELLYFISSEEGQLFRQNVYSSSRIKPISEIIGKRVLDEELSRNDVIKLFNSSNRYIEDESFNGLQYKKNSVCLRGNHEQNYRLEFRIPNGGCNYKTWIDNIRLYGKMMEVSKRLADSMNKGELSNDDERLLRIKIDLQDNTLSNEEKLVLLMNLLFEEDNIKQIYYDRYISTIKKITETNSDNYVNYNSNFEPNFDEVQFTGYYQSRLNPEFNEDGIVIEYDPETNTITSNRKK